MARISKARTTRASTATTATERRLALVLFLIALGLSLSSGALASDATLGTTIDRWSRTIGADARSVSLAAKQRHPRLMTMGALRFRKDALRAHAAIGAQRASRVAGLRAKSLALRAFSNYAMAGKRWAASGRARLTHRKARAWALARSANTFAKRGNRLLVAAGKLVT